jgi:hypothetical protein
MQYRHPTQSEEETKTIPSERCLEAPVGQTRTQAGSEQWWHCSGSNKAVRLGQSPFVSSLSQLRYLPSGTLFCALQDTAHALQLMHFLESTTRA